MAEKLPSKAEQQPDRKHQDILNNRKMDLAKDLLGIKVENTGKNEREKMKEALDAQAEIKSATFDIGKSDVPNELRDEVDAANPEAVVGSVDAHKFKMEWHKPDWYKPFTEATANINNLKSLFDEPTMEWYKSLSPAFEVFQNLAKMSDKDFAKNVKKNIWDLVKKKGGEEMVYGAKGFFNFVLAFQRIAGMYSPLKDLAGDKNFDLTAMSVKKIKLVAGKNLGEQDGKNDRFAYAIIRKGAVEQKGPEQKTPEFNDEFFTKYKIDPKNRADFMAGVKLFDDFLKNPERGAKFLTTSDWMEKKEKETDAQFNIRMNKLFSDGGEIYNLRAGFDQARVLYDKFYTDASNPSAVKYASLYNLATLKTIEYIDKNFDESREVRTARFVEYHKSLVEALDPVRSMKNPFALKQLVDSTKYLSENDPVGSKENWKKRSDSYAAELAALDKK